MSRSFPELSTTLTALRRTDLTLVLSTSWIRLRVKILRVYSLMRLSSAGSQVDLSLSGHPRLRHVSSALWNETVSCTGNAAGENNAGALWTETVSCTGNAAGENNASKEDLEVPAWQERRKVLWAVLTVCDSTLQRLS